MNIIWICDYTTKQHQGGAQQTNHIMVEAGRELGHSIEYLTPLEFSAKRIKEADLVITNNIMKFSSYQTEWLIANVPYVRYEHDYDATKKYPDIYKKSKLNIFLSPLHHAEAERIVGEKIKAEVIPSPVLDFEDKGMKREGILWVGNLVPEKGLSNIIRYMKQNRDKNLRIVGFNSCPLSEELESLENTQLVGEVEHSKMIDEYNKAKDFIHLPKWKEPFGRVILEAYLSGCNLIVNNNCGAMSYDWDFNDYESIKQKVASSPKVFWETIKQYV